MSENQNIPTLLTLMLVLCLCSCEKAESDERELFPDTLPIDCELLGEWHRSFNMVSDYTWITVYTDSIKFNSDNMGLYRSFRFRDLWFCDTFQFYIEDHNIYFKSNVWRNGTWTYAVHNDSLYISGTSPYIR